MKNDRKIAALRALAERPGTPAEGKVAREMLAKLLAKPASPDEPVSPTQAFEQFMRGAASAPPPLFWTCACGTSVRMGQKCQRQLWHLHVQTQIRVRFSPGDRVFYNYYCYPPNCPGTVSGYVRLKAEKNGSHPWAWIRIKFDHLATVRAVPIFSARGWHLSTLVMPDEAAERLGRA